jgi:hypothetical protein
MSLVISMLLAVSVAAQEPAPETEPTAQQEAENEAEAPAAAEEGEPAEAAAPPSNSFETTIGFTPLNQASLDGTAGQIEIQTVEFEVAGAKGGGIGGVFSSADSDMQAILTTRLTLKTSAETKVKFDMMIEFLDEKQQVIDRALKSDSFKQSQKTFDIKHTTLRWAVDHIDQARITVAVKD